MASFTVKLGSGDGEIAVRQVHGASPAEIREHYSREGFYVFSVKRTLDLASLLGFSRKIPARKFIIFNREFRGLVKAGLPIVQGLDLLLKRSKPDRLREVLVQVREQVVKGVSLSDAFSAFTSSVPAYYPALLRAGEQSGNLVEVLDRFIDQEEHSRKARKKFAQALTYPILLLAIASVSMYVILTQAMPEFASLYQEGGKELPAVTRAVTGFSRWLAAYHTPLLIMFATALVTLFLYTRTDRGALQADRLLGRLPIVGSLWRLRNQNIFARTLKLLLTGGIPVPEALSVCAGAVLSRVFGQELRRVEADVSAGDSLQAALERHTRLDETANEMIRVGEATGTLTDMLDYLADQGEERSEDLLDLITNLIAPLVLLMVGLVIAFLVVAMYLPMFGSYDVLNR